MQEGTLGFFIIMSSVLEEHVCQLHIKKTTKENHTILRILNIGVDKVVQSCIQVLRREFKNMVMKKELRVFNFSLSSLMYFQN